MNIYLSGIGGVGIGALAEIAQSAGHTVFGSDQKSSPMSKNLEKIGVEIEYGAQDGNFLKQKFIENGVDWFVYTAALPPNHPEILAAQDLGIKISKRDELLNEIIQEKGLKLIAISGTHGKTTATGMAIWAFQQLGIPVSWSVGATLSFGKSGFFDPKSKFFIYEADEFDRNFLNFTPAISLITSIDRDHTDIYKTEQEYFEAFVQFAAQSDFVIAWRDQHAEIFEKIHNKVILQKSEPEISLAGEHNRKNATLVLEALDYLAETENLGGEELHERAIEALNNFPGTDRRFEKINANIFSDYGHHPIEIRSTLELAREVAQKNNFSGVALIYQPHQNVRQVEIQAEYTPEIFENADEVLWLPTFLSRENPELQILTPAELSKQIFEKTEFFEIEGAASEKLRKRIEELEKQNRLILAMSAGSLDAWIRQIAK
ncbi:MAG: Mur ligase domain-containing protein [bacterium]|nr:Mur ligase domain-containing protein [bacterium]